MAKEANRKAQRPKSKSSAVASTPALAMQPAAIAITGARRAALLDLITQGRGRIRSCRAAGIDPALFADLMVSDEEFRLDVLVAEASLRESVQEVFYIQASSGSDVRIIAEYMAMRERDARLYMDIEKHDAQMNAIEGGSRRIDLASVVARVADTLMRFIPDDRIHQAHAAVLALMEETEIERGTPSSPSPRSRDMVADWRIALGIDDSGDAWLDALDEAELEPNGPDDAELDLGDESVELTDDEIDDLDEFAMTA